MSLALDDCLGDIVITIGALAESCPRSAELQLLTELAAVAERPSSYAFDEYDAVLERLRVFQREKSIFDRVVAHAILRQVFVELADRTASRRA